MRVFCSVMGLWAHSLTSNAAWNQNLLRIHRHLLSQRLLTGALLALGAALLALSAAGCATAPTPIAAEAPTRDRDPFAALPSATHALEAIAPYRFASEHTLRLDAATVRLSQSTNPTSHLVLARAWLDAALYSELAAAPDFDDALAGSVARLPVAAGARPATGLWPAVDALFASLLADPAASVDVRTLAEQGQALVELLTTRAMDRDYHHRLNAFAAEGQPFAAEARVAILLDTAQALTAAADLPLLERLDALTEVLRDGVCPPEAPAGTCEPACFAAHPHLATLPPDRRELLALATCGFEEVGYAHAAPADLYGPGVDVVVAAYRRAAVLLEVMRHSQGHPLIDAALPELERLHAELQRHALPLPIRADAPDDLHGLPLPIADSDRAEAQPVDPVLIVIDRDGLRVSVTPHFVADAHGATLAELAEGFAFPGRLIAAWGDIQHPGDSRHAIIVQHLERAIGQAEALTPSEEAPPPPMAVVVASDLDGARLTLALDLLRDATLEGRRLALALAAWSSAHGELRFLPVAMLPASAWATHTFGDLPEDARPLDLIVALRADRVDLFGAGRLLRSVPDRDGHTDLEALRGVITDLLAQHPGQVAADVEFDTDRKDTTELLALVAILQDSHLALDTVVLSSAPDLD